MFASVVLHARASRVSLKLLVDHIDRRLTNLAVLLALLDVKAVFQVATGNHATLIVVVTGTQRLSRLIELLLLFSLLFLLFFNVSNEFSLDLCFSLLLKLKLILCFLGSLWILFLDVIHDPLVLRQL